jgi:hypothetical protein|tara:strand:+ start:15640 stop:15996 length:357 start_codon:yes stop_codon:yes gene_type:complete
MKLSSSNFKALATSAGFTFWFFIITTSLGLFSLEYLAIFVLVVVSITQIFASKLSKILDIIAMINTKLFLGILFIFLIAVYGILFKILKIDPLRRQKNSQTYWLEMEDLKSNRIFKQY